MRTNKSCEVVVASGERRYRKLSSIEIWPMKTSTTPVVIRRKGIEVDVCALVTATNAMQRKAFAGAAECAEHRVMSGSKAETLERDQSKGPDLRTANRMVLDDQGDQTPIVSEVFQESKPKGAKSSLPPKVLDGSWITVAQAAVRLCYSEQRMRNLIYLSEKAAKTFSAAACKRSFVDCIIRTEGQRRLYIDVCKLEEWERGQASVCEAAST